MTAPATVTISAAAYDLATVVKAAGGDPASCLYAGGVLSVPGVTQAALAAAVAGYNASAVTLVQEAAALLNAGRCVIASASMPAVDGTYAIDPISRAAFGEVVAGINAGAGLPGGGASFIYDDVCGAHTFAAVGTVTAAAQVLAVGSALRNYIYAVTQTIQNRTTVLPTQPWQIP